jgi:hypothetical protein
VKSAFWSPCHTDVEIDMISLYGFFRLTVKGISVGTFAENDSPPLRRSKIRTILDGNGS